MDMGASGDDLSRESKKVQGLIFQMTTSVSSFKRAVDSLGTGKDTREPVSYTHLTLPTILRV